jgi:hypothetical protein
VIQNNLRLLSNFRQEILGSLKTTLEKYEKSLKGPIDTYKKLYTYREKYFEFGKFLGETSQISQKVFKSIFFWVNTKIDNNCNVLRGVYDRLYSDICIYQGSAMNIFFDYYSLVPVLCTMMAIVFGLGNFLFFNNEKRASGMVQTVGPITSILRISAMNPSLIWTLNLRNTPA